MAALPPDNPTRRRPILAAFTGWARHTLGLDASAQLAWIEAAASDNGALPEQTG